ncbi:PilZ domain-containing protein [Stutzerimonas kirkiae]|uniref:PilZ domain-containing protein n=1 Tax=Stutzerimonas kirkiae TaxID=2211392 RepID=A0A4Q9RAP5_9GAMM|nr:PilZ domain-containing protein [Stutzerimonas kirkiae]TBU97236.1 PilZ domain-containing protein [Stutzerimonas kirkiae]TBV03658.1 PilZ domain-containing protein [Stutzerimonas kirkiae]TBV11356.1 PilZ domain-containing protein [Stutzerimonas kirkiae]TBV12465.1 PilZ domain-containing protein [Stutzerimonas kirkiae]
MSGIDRHYTEKRNFIRMNVDSRATLIAHGQQFEAHCLDLSSTGLQLLARTELDSGDEVDVLIPSSHPGLKGLQVKARVVRTARHDDDRQSLGLEIIAMS